jgi:hypothetical protein
MVVGVINPSGVVEESAGIGCHETWDVVCDSLKAHPTLRVLHLWTRVTFEGQSLESVAQIQTRDSTQTPYLFDTTGAASTNPSFASTNPSFGNSVMLVDFSRYDIQSDYAITKNGDSD